MKNLLSLLFAFFILTGCKFGSYPSFENVEYVKDIEKKFSLSNGQLLELDLFRLRSIEVLDSLLMVSSTDKEGSLSIFNINNNYEFMGKYLREGRGRNEVLTYPHIGEQLIYKEGNDYMVMLLCPNGFPNTYKFNLSKSIKERKTNVEDIEMDFQTKDGFYRHYSRFIAKNTFFSTEFPYSGDDKINRYIIHNGERKENKNMNKLSEISSKHEDFTKFVYTIPSSKPTGDIVVEVQTNFNLINLYSIHDDSFAKTICIGKKMISLEELIDKGYFEELVHFHIGVKSFDDFFGAVSIKSKERLYYTDPDSRSKIRFFDWSGKPLCSLSFDTYFRDFDIDFQNKTLYTMVTNREIEEIRRYDISEVLDYLESEKSH